MSGCVSFSRCEPCMYGSHYDPPREHPWAGPEDVEHARQTGQQTPTGLCACDECGNPPSDEERARVAAALTAVVEQHLASGSPS